MTDLPEVREANNSGSTIAQYPDGTWYWLDETWNYGDDTHYPTYEEAARAQNLYCIESLGIFDELLKDNPFLDPTCPKCGGLAIDSAIWTYMITTCLSCGCELESQSLNEGRAELIEICEKEQLNELLEDKK